MAAFSLAWSSAGTLRPCCLLLRDLELPTGLQQGAAIPNFSGRRTEIIQGLMQLDAWVLSDIGVGEASQVVGKVFCRSFVVHCRSSGNMSFLGERIRSGAIRIAPGSSQRARFNGAPKACLQCAPCAPCRRVHVLPAGFGRNLNSRDTRVRVRVQ